MNSINPNLSNDAELLQHMEQGSKHAFNVLYEKYWSQTYSNAYKRLKDDDQAKDVVQEIFTHIWLKKETLHIDNLPAYLNIAVRNRVFKLIEKQKLIHPFFDTLETMPAMYLQADANLLWKEFFRSYEALLTTLPPQRQLIFRLRFQEDLPTKNIATQLGLCRKTVQNQLGKAIEQLRISLLQLLTVLITLLSATAN
ncbi:sigma-70 family RNA polymerase sigma factor [Daejeonella sp.]|uniref:sigma-70 family RNA polymerase sigma factor n=1 Tax=Daejeonella sp. TaxID=2805397 RepID=UPI003983BA9C